MADNSRKLTFPFEVDLTSPSLQDDLVALSQRPDRVLLSGEYSQAVVVINEDMILKCGYGVYVEEFHNQAHACEHIDLAKVCIPKVFLFFRRKRRGYLLMERIKGHPPTVADVKDVAEALRLLHDLPVTRELHDKPGPINGGFARLHFAENVKWESKTDLQDFLNARLLQQGERFDLKNSQLCFVHMDIAPRNILRTSDGRVCLIDWEAAGLYPRHFEYAILKGTGNTVPGNNEFKFAVCQALLDLVPLTHIEQGECN